MQIQEHVSKAERITSSLQKCGREDYEALIEGAMLAATHWFNAALHSKGIRRVDNDVMHGTKLTIEEHKRCETLLEGMAQALEVIEELRSPYVRGAEANGEAAGTLALQKLGLIAAATRALI